MSHLCTLPSLLPLFLPSGLKSELPKNGRVPLHLLPPWLHPAKNTFLGFFSPLLFCSQEPQQNLSLNLRRLCQVASQLPESALSTDHKCLPQAIHPLFTSPGRQRGTRSPRHPFVQGREYHVNGRPPKIYSPPLFAWCHCLLGLDSKLR